MPRAIILPRAIIVPPGVYIRTYIYWQYKVMAQFPFLLPLLVSLSVPLPIPFHLLRIPPFAWCDRVHLGPRLLVNWPPPPHSILIPSPFPPHSNFPTPRGFPKWIVRLTKTTSRLRLHRVRNSTRATYVGRHGSPPCHWLAFGQILPITYFLGLKMKMIWRISF